MNRTGAFEEIYTNRYFKAVIDAMIKGLTILATLSLDIGILFWVRGLKFELEKRIKEAEKKLKKS